MRDTFTSRDLKAGCFVCHSIQPHWTGPNAQALAAQHHDRTKHQTWCEVHLSIRYGADAGDDRQTDLEDAIAFASASPMQPQVAEACRVDAMSTRPPMPYPPEKHGA